MADTAGHILPRHSGVPTVNGMHVDPDSPEHPYQQLAAHLRQQIADGTITSRLPSYYMLMDETGLSLGAIQRTIRLLASEGLVFTVPGRGVFVRAK
jgi:GntR family transcriptional regulator